MAKIKLDGYQCCRCGHIWAPRPKRMEYESELPIICPKCKSGYWNIPKGEKK